MSQEMSVSVNISPYELERGTRSYRRVIAFLAFSKLRVPSSLMLVMISFSFSSGRMVETASSSLIWPRSTHWRAAIEVMSLEQDARIKVALRSIGSVEFFGPNALSYLKVPG